MEYFGKRPRMFSFAEAVNINFHLYLFQNIIVGGMILAGV